MLDLLAFFAPRAEQAHARRLQQAGRNLSDDDRCRLSRADPMPLHRALTGSLELLIVWTMGGLIELAMALGRGAADDLFDPSECGQRARQCGRVDNQQTRVLAKGSDGCEAFGFALRDPLLPS